MLFRLLGSMYKRESNYTENTIHRKLYKCDLFSGQIIDGRTPLTHCGLVTIYGEIDLDQHWLSSRVSCGIYHEFNP